VLVDVSNTAASPLLLELISNITGDSWCVPLYGRGGYYPWSSFKTQCTTPGGGVAYDATDAITGLAIKVPGTTGTQVPFDVCLNAFGEANSGFVGSCVTREPPCSPALIDDFEGELGWIYAQDGRSGLWVTYDDGSADAGAHEVFLQSSPGHESEHALRARGSGFTEWGTGVGARLNDPPGAEKSHAYDASAYAGVRFWYQSQTQIAFRLQTLDTTSIYNTFIDGGTCTFSVGQCANFAFVLPPAASWTEVALTWDQITQPDWSLIVDTELDPATIVELRWESMPGDTFDYQIDDVSFF
jgi:hypothetical protein